MTEIEIIEAMVKLEEKLAERYNASIQLINYSDYLGTFNSWSKDLQGEITKIDDPEIVKFYFENIETNEVEYFDINFN